jgi:3-deoxy-7-phosphoheptulonate synthase
MKLNLLLFYLNWYPSSWEKLSTKQIPEYQDKIKLNQVKSILNYKNPLVFAGEIRNLKEQLKLAQEGKQFIFQAGPCMEEIKDNQINEIKNLFSLIVQTSLVLSFGLEKKIIRIGRLAGQYAKPRSELFEKDGKLTFRGNIVHSLLNREPDPYRMIEAYHHASSTLNAIRSFAKSGDLDLANIDNWLYSVKEYNYYPYKDFQNTIKKTVQFIQNCGIYNYNALFREPEFYTSHEALLLHYEEALTRKDSLTQKYYNCGAHSLWLGERTRLSNGHIEYLKGIENPIGIKIGPNSDINQLIYLIKTLNSSNESGKIMLIFRLGSDNINYQNELNNIINNIQLENLNVLYMCDPCHANTKIINNQKTRYIYTIQNEILKFFEVCKSKNIIPAGIHIEITGENVTECIGLNVKYDELRLNYLSKVDPRLNPIQTLDLAFYISSINNKI